MRKLSLATSILLLLLGALPCVSAHAERGTPQPGRFHGAPFQHHVHRVFVFVGAPIFWAWYYAPDAGYDAQLGPMDEFYALPPAPAYLYYCADANAFYPYVAECLDGWKMVVPAPAN